MDSHHAHHARKRARRRMAVDVVVVLFFLLAIAGIVFSHFNSSRIERERVEALQKLRDEVAALEKQNASARPVGITLPPSSQSTVSTTTEDALTVPLLSGDAPESTGTEVELSSGVSANESAPALETATSVGADSFILFDDVTTERHHDTRLGFVMELPSGWRVAYERGDTMLFANNEYWYGVTDAEVAKRDEAMWIRVVRPCDSANATSTVFGFASTTGTLVREATACILPFLVTLGYRADAGDFLGRERFLLSVARTFYPVVSSTAPYVPIR